MSRLCHQGKQSHLLLSSPVDKIFNEDKDEGSSSSDTTNFSSRISETKPSFIKNQRIQQFFFKMYLVFKEIAIILFVAITYAALTNDAPKLSKSPAAFPFFSKDSIVIDWFHGELTSAIIKARESDIAFVMFYAAWDAESQDIRKEFDLAARYMQKEVLFAAINCWQPNSECRKQYTKAYSWPVLIAYLTHGKGVQYKGPHLASYMVKFLKSLTRPFVRIYDSNEINDLLTMYDAVILGCIDASPGSYSYKFFYSLALKFLERDPLQEVIFAVFTGCKLESDNPPSISLHMWNETLIYMNEEWKSAEMLTWILMNLHQVTMWVSPTGSKSMSLSSYLQPGPTLLLFTPRNPLEFFIDYYTLLHEVALEYYNCGKNVQVELGLTLIKKKRADDYQKHLLLQETCSIKLNSKLQEFRSTVTFSSPKKLVNNSCSKCESVDLLNDHVQSHCYKIKQKSEEICEMEEFERGSELCKIKDPRSATNIIKLWQDEKCRIATIANTIFPTVIPNKVDINNFTKILGWAFKSNSSLTFIALDSIRYFHFAHRLGVEPDLFKDKTAAVIINQKAETHHILYEEVNDVTLREFITNFTLSSLPRSYDSEATLKVDSNPIAQRNIPTSNIFLLELNTESFFPIVMQENKAVIVFYYSKQCSFCSGISYTFLTVAKMLRSIQLIKFTRFDGDFNILPWAFTMDRYPTIIFFPRKNKSETRVFPRDIPITVSNLVNFILVNLNPSLKLHVMWTLCNQTVFQKDRKMCIASLRSENLSVINNTLRAWRCADPLTKTKLLHKLQQLRNLNLLLAHSPQHETDIKRYLDRLHFATSEDATMRNVEKNVKDNVHDEL